MDKGRIGGIVVAMSICIGSLFSQINPILVGGGNIPCLYQKKQAILSTDVTFDQEMIVNGTASYSPWNNVGVMLTTEANRRYKSLGAAGGLYRVIASDSLNNVRKYIDFYIGIERNAINVEFSDILYYTYYLQSGINLVEKQNTTFSIIAKLNVVDVSIVSIEDLLLSSEYLNDINENDPYIIPSLLFRTSFARDGIGLYLQGGKQFYKKSIMVENGLSVTIGISIHMNKIKNNFPLFKN